MIGDTPYGQPQVENSPNDISEINADLQVRLVMHLGDIKNGSSQCSTRYFEQIRADFNQFEEPMDSPLAPTNGPTATAPTTAPTGRPERC